MNNHWASGCMAMAYITLVGGILAGLILAFTLHNGWFVLIGLSGVPGFFLFGGVAEAVQNTSDLLALGLEKKDAEKTMQRKAQAEPAASKQAPVPPVSAAPASSGSSSKITYKALGHTASDREAWFCPNCGKPHEFFIDYCGCGYNKKDSPLRPMAAEIVKEVPEKADSTGSENP